MPARSKFLSRSRSAALEVFRAGGSVRQAAKAAGVDHQTMSRWIQRGAGAPAGTMFRRFHNDVAAAQASSPALVPLVAAPEPSADADLAWKFLEEIEPGFARPPARRHARNVERAVPEPIEVTVVLSNGEPYDRAAVHEVLQPEGA